MKRYMSYASWTIGHWTLYTIAISLSSIDDPKYLLKNNVRIKRNGKTTDIHGVVMNLTTLKIRKCPIILQRSILILIITND